MRRMTLGIALVVAGLLAAPDTARPQQPGAGMASGDGAPMLLPGGRLAVWRHEGDHFVLASLRDFGGGDSGPDLEPGDVLLTLQGEEPGEDDLFARYRAIPVGRAVRLQIRRNGRERDVVFEHPGATHVIPPAGTAAGDPGGGESGTGWTADTAGIETQPRPAVGGFELAAAGEGVSVVLKLVNPANDGIPLRVGDVIVRVGGIRVTDPLEVVRRWQALELGEALRVQVSRDGRIVPLSLRR